MSRIGWQVLQGICAGSMSSYMVRRTGSTINAAVAVALVVGGFLMLQRIVEGKS